MKTRSYRGTIQMNTISSPKAPAAIGPYSQAIVSGKFVFTSGQIPLSPADGSICGDTIELQTEAVMKNLHEVLIAAGSSFEGIVKTTCYLADMQDFQAFNTIYAKHILNAPARSCVAAKCLPKNVLVEVEAIAEVLA